jgi:hypothetical protein
MNQNYLKIQFVPRSKHSPSRASNRTVMMYKEVIAVRSKIHTKHINILAGQNIELSNVKPGGSYSNHWALTFYSPLVSCTNRVNT